MTAGGLTIEVEEDGDMLVENAAAASLFSPGMWVQRPQRTPAAAAADAHAAAPCSTAVRGGPYSILLTYFFLYILGTGP